MKSNLQYDWTQRREIELARQKELNTAIMENPNYLAEQMQEIRLGLEAGLDVSVYAKPEFDWFQMEQIRMGLEEHVDVSQYAFCEYSYETMKQIRLAWHTFVDLKPYLEKGFKGEELEEIRLALEKELPIGDWIAPEMYSYQIRQVALGLEEGIDVSFYADSSYSWRQMREIRLGLEHRIEVSWYAKQLMKPRQMEEIRLGLEEGLDVSVYATMLNSGVEMHAKRLELLAQQGNVEKAVQQKPQILHKGERRSLLLNLAVEEGGMKAYLYMEGSEVEDLSREELLYELKQKGIVFGIMENALDKILSGQVRGGRIQIAEGIAAQNGSDGWYEFFVRTDGEMTPVILPDGSVDYMGFNAFETVKVGQKIACYHRACQGKDGRDIFDNRVPAQIGHEKATLRGTGFVLDEDKVTYLAKKAGRFELVNDRIVISNVIIIQEDVTGVFGKVVVDGSVHVRGSIHSGGYVEATGDIIVDGNVEAAKLKAGRDIIIRRGTCSRKECYIEAGRKVSGNFFEAAYICAGEGVNANYLMNSWIKTLGKVIVSGRKGAIIGGRVSAVKGVESYNIGNEADITTILDIGKNDVYHEKFRALTKKKEQVLSDIRIFEEGWKKISRYSEEERGAYAPTISKLMLGIKMKNKELSEVEKKMDDLVGRTEQISQLAAVVRGTAYAGTTAVIDGIGYTLPQDIEHIRFIKKNKKVVMVRL